MSYTRNEANSEDRFMKMTRTPVERLVVSLAVPTIISMLITSIYNMADTYFVSQISTSASGAVGIAFALMAIIQAIGFTFGMGSGNYISRLLGQKNEEYASKVAATGFYSALGFGAILAVVGLILLDPLVYALGATETIAPFAKDYIRYILIGMPYMAASFVLNNILRFQGNAYYAMLGIGTGAVLNIIMDPIFIFVLDMGTGGAALATIISQLVSFCILLHNSRRYGTVRIHIRDFSPRWRIYREIFGGGLPSFYRQAFGSVAMIALNFSAGPFGDAAIAAMSIVTRVFHFALSALIGFGQGFQPVCGFNYGAGLYSRVREAFRFCVKTSTVVLTAIGAVFLIFSPHIIAQFRREDMEVIAIGTRALRLYCLGFPLAGWIIMTNMLLQTIGKSTQASFVAIARQGLFFLPAVLIMPGFIGILGLQLSQPISDLLTFIIAIPMGINVLREIKSLEQKQEKADMLQKVLGEDREAAQV